MGFDLPSKWTSRQEAKFLRYAHWFTLITTSVMVVICIVRIGLRMNGVGVNRAVKAGASASWGTGVAAKGLIFALYQVLTSPHGRFPRFGSLKANMILNCIDAPFWIALVAISAGGMSSCISPMCALNGIIIAIALVLFLVALPVAYFSTKHFIEFKRTGRQPEEDVTSHSLPIYQSKSGLDQPANELKYQPTAYAPTHQTHQPRGAREHTYSTRG